MTTKAPKRSRIATVLRFFREGHPDEVRAVFHILAADGLLPDAPKVKQVRRRRSRLNGAEVEVNSTPVRAEGATA